MTGTVRYMGSKRTLAPEIGRLISELYPHATVADAFAGTCAVGSATAASHHVIANDMHAYAETIAYATLVAPGEPPKPKIAKAELWDLIQDHQSLLIPLLYDRLDEERRSLICADSGEYGQLLDFNSRERQATVPLVLNPSVPIDAYRADPKNVPFLLCSSYFSSSYFGVAQAAMIDSLRFAIDQSSAARKPFYMLAFLQAISHCGATPGHFAQYLVPRDRKTASYIGRLRSRNPWTLFLAALDQLRLPRCLDRGKNRVTKMDATEFVRQLKCGDSAKLVIYADPPYSRAQYSRYYHVLESLVLYDYPVITGNGRYRDDRVNTDFSRSAGVERAMSGFVAAAAESSSALFLSYPANGLYCGASRDLRELLLASFNNAEILAATPLSHSTLGGAPGTASVDVIETIYHGWN